MQIEFHTPDISTGILSISENEINTKEILDDFAKCGHLLGTVFFNHLRRLLTLCPGNRLFLATKVENQMVSEYTRFLNLPAEKLQAEVDVVGAYIDKDTGNPKLVALLHSNRVLISHSKQLFDLLATTGTQYPNHIIIGTVPYVTKLMSPRRMHTFLETVVNIMKELGYVVE